jgi:AmmeMemoRadiSam system protein B
MVRQAVVAGQFYAGNSHELENQIKGCFLDKRGPSVLPSNKRKGVIKGAIIPHAGYSYSGPCAAWAYKEIAEAEFPDLFIIIGPNHSGEGKTATMMDDWQTPFGIIRVNKDFVQEIVKKTGIALDSSALAREHSIEVQLPFLQFITRETDQQARFVPIVVSHGLNIKKFALDLKELIMESGKNVCIIVSSDFTHYGPAYGYLPFELDKEKSMYEMDGEAIKLIKEQNVEGFLKFVKETGATICGQIGIAVLMATLPKSQVKLLQYYTSGDLVKNYKNAVGYAAILFR